MRGFICTCQNGNEPKQAPQECWRQLGSVLGLVNRLFTIQDVTVASRNTAFDAAREAIEGSSQRHWVPRNAAASGVAIHH